MNRSTDYEGRADMALRSIRSWCDDPPDGWPGTWLPVEQIADHIDAALSNEPPPVEHRAGQPGGTRIIERVSGDEYVTTGEYRVRKDGDSYLDPQTGNVYGANAHESGKQIIVTPVEQREQGRVHYGRDTDGHPVRIETWVPDTREPSEDAGDGCAMSSELTSISYGNGSVR